VVVGAPGENASGNLSAGHAYVYQALTGTLMATLASPNPLNGGNFGSSVAVSGTRIVIGAPFETTSGDANAGRAYLFDATTDGLISTYVSPNPQTFGYFGDSVSISGTTVAIGAEGENVSSYSAAGHVYVFKATTSGLLDLLTSPNAQTAGFFGCSVSVSGTKVVVGAFGESAPRFDEAGRAYVFLVTDGALVYTLTSPGEQSGGGFGDAVAISGSTIVVGAPGEGALGYDDAGHAYVFGATTGTLISTLTSPNAQAYGYFGTSVAVDSPRVIVFLYSGTTVLVGAPDEGSSGYPQAGNAYRF